ncbi:uncharacterized protein B0P05DRAFT_476300 [Gilbertella persicaria]|uniref:uncharacterized protein n=1 Tax=Gilbertella persicaria TaxID=101096 RepID=UPI00221E56E5|nr:uncharacterized protein B0P05DRAFT_476300 [Gilbertella persicaria]KAI8064868.1 hypothetical protein B0P05DRAFT_476300 [Gilbertella persicaria]
MVPELEEMESPFEKEEWIVKQMSNIISATIADNDTDDLLHDDTIRNASRTFRQIFDVPSSERLVNCMYTYLPGIIDRNVCRLFLCL